MQKKLQLPKKYTNNNKLSDAEKLQLQTGGLMAPDAHLPKRLTDNFPDIVHVSVLVGQLNPLNTRFRPPYTGTALK